MGIAGSLAALLLLGSARLAVSIAGWESYDPPLPFVLGVAASPDSDLTLYAVATGANQEDTGVSASSLFRSLDGGLNWTDLADAPPGEQAVALAVNPFSAAELLAGTAGPSGSQVYRSVDTAATWEAVLSFPSCYGPSIVFDTAVPGRAYAACGTVFRTDDGTSWTRLGVEASGRLVAGADGAVFLVGNTQVLRSQNHGDSWVPILDAPRSCPAITAFAVDPSSPSTFYVGTGLATSNGHFGCGGLYKKADGASLARTSLPDRFVSGIVVDPADGSIVYACSVNVGFFSPPGGVSRSLDGGRTWSEFGPAQGGPIRQLVLSGRFLYALSDWWGGPLFRVTIRKTRSVERAP
jgi:hypothetical protein